MGRCARREIAPIHRIRYLALMCAPVAVTVRLLASDDASGGVEATARRYRRSAVETITVAVASVAVDNHRRVCGHRQCGDDVAARR